MSAYYNEIDPYAAEWLRNLIAFGLLPPGDVDERSIVDVRADDLAGYSQCHFFAGIGGWGLAARLAGWPDDRQLWTGSCPCQPFSVAGKGAGQADARHLWPEFFRLIDARRPDVVVGEQVAAAVGKSWLDGVYADLEGVGYACGAVVVPACAVDAPHRRDRLWFVADAGSLGRGARRHNHAEHDGPVAYAAGQSGGDVADADSQRGQVHSGAGRREDGGCAGQVAGSGGARDGNVADADLAGPQGRCGLRDGADERAPGSDGMAWRGATWLTGADGKARRVEPGIRLLAHGISNRVAKLRAFGNAIVPQVAAEVLRALL